MVTSELHIIYITSDGSKFLYKEDAIFHEEHLKEEDWVEYEEFLEDEWELADNGNYGRVGSHFNNLPQFQLSPEEYKIVKKEQEKRKNAKQE